MIWFYTQSYIITFASHVLKIGLHITIAVVRQILLLGKQEVGSDGRRVIIIEWCAAFVGVDRFVVESGIIVVVRILHLHVEQCPRIGCKAPMLRESVLVLQHQWYVHIVAGDVLLDLVTGNELAEYLSVAIC